MSIGMRGMQMKCSFTNAKIARSSRDCAHCGHCVVCSLFAKFAGKSRDFRYCNLVCSKFCSSAIFVIADLCIGDVALWEPDPRTLRRTQQRFPPSAGARDCAMPTAVSQSRVQFWALLQSLAPKKRMSTNGCSLLFTALL